MNTINKIAIIGSGGIGSRHLQSLSKIDKALQINVVDPNSKCLKMAKRRFKEVSKSKLNKNIIFSKSIKSIKDDLDIAIIATNADIRKIVIDELISLVKVKYMIIEKVAFQTNESFIEIIKKFDDLNIICWVNCTRRMMPFYKNIKKKIINEKKIRIKVEGSNWGLACNTIHMLDLFAFLTGDYYLNIDISGLDNNLYPSKRDSMIEFRGILVAKTESGDILTLIDDKEYADNNFETIKTKNYCYKISYLENKVNFSCSEDGWIVKTNIFSLPNQSDLTHVLIKDILDHGDCDLTPLNESYKLHSQMLNSFENHLINLTGNKYDFIPIT